MQRWNTKPSPGPWIGLVLLIITAGGGIFLGLRLGPALLRPPEEWAVDLALYGELVAVVCLTILAGVLAYRVAGGLTMGYTMDRNGIYIHWLGNRAVIPIDDIEQIDSGDRHARIPLSFLQGVGYYWGQGRTSKGQRLHLFSTLPPDKCLILHTSNDAYAVSPARRDTFVQNLEQRRRIGAVKPLSHAQQPGRMVFYAFWSDPVVRWSILLAFGLNLLLLGILAGFYPELAANIPMRFDPTGQVAELRPRHQVLFLPLAATGLLLLNTALGLALYRREETGARLLQVASVLAQVLFSVAVFAIITRS
ncbi:MAG: hypothetical protein HC884_19775 [Chloroflexaceae bacterium]|nr:hypothetical protein [Chloroflexaceae bacterium]